MHQDQRHPKIQGNTSRHPAEKLTLKRMAILNNSQDVEQQEFLYYAQIQ